MTSTARRRYAAVDRWSSMGRISAATRRPNSAAIASAAAVRLGRQPLLGVAGAQHRRTDRARRDRDRAVLDDERDAGDRDHHRVAHADLQELLWSACDRHDDLDDELAGRERGALRADEELVDRELPAARRGPHDDRRVERGRARGAGRRPATRCRGCRRSSRRCGSAGEPTVRAACASAGSDPRASGSMSCVQVTPRPEPDRVARDRPRPQLVDSTERHDVVGTPVAEVHLDHEVGAAGEHMRLGMRGERVERLVERRRAQDGHRGILVGAGQPPASVGLEPLGDAAVPGQHLVDPIARRARRRARRARPATTVWRAALGPHRSHASIGSLSAPAWAMSPSTGHTTRSPTAPTESSPISPVRPRHPAPPRVAISSASRAPVDAGPPRSRPSSIALRASIQSDAESVDDEPSQPSPTGDPAARRSATGSDAPSADHHVRARAVRDADAGAPEPRDLGRVGIDAVRDPAAIGHPPDRLEVVDRAPAELLGREAILVGVLGEVRVQPHVEPLGQLGGADHQLAGHAERRARRERDPHHRAVGAVVVQPRPDARSRRGSRRRPARPSRAAAHRPSATGSSSRASGGSACRARSRRGSRR